MELYQYEWRHLEALRGPNAGCTLLLRRNGAFPLSGPCSLALYGSGARHTVKGGTGSGEVNSRFFTSVEQGLKDEGFEITTASWLDSYDRKRTSARESFRQQIRKQARQTHQLAVVLGMGAVMPEPAYDIPLKGDGDAALYVLSRTSGEGSDRKAIKGDVLLTDSEIRDIKELDSRFDRFMLVLNVAAPVDLSPVSDVSNILLLGQLGTETGAVLADLLLGRSYPSGKLTNTWAAWPDYSHTGDECARDDTRYREGIYVGYRYFDAAGKEPLFPFGYGLGYTDFALETEDVGISAGRVSVRVSVRNTGAYPGREVVQIYCSASNGILDRPVQDLAGFRKTEELLPGERESVTIFFELSDLAGYDPARAVWILEAGDYILRMGSDSRNTVPVAILRLKEEIIVQKVKNVLSAPDFTDWRPDPLPEERVCPEGLPILEVSPAGISGKPVDYSGEYPSDENTEALTDEELIHLSIGAFNEKGGISNIIGAASLSVAGAAGETSRILGDRGPAPLVMADGPAGLRLSKTIFRDDKGLHSLGSTIPQSVEEYLPGVVKLFAGGSYPKKGAKIQHQYATAIPVGNSLAQSWDPAYAGLCGSVVAEEMRRFGVHLWLAPALNIQRNILCGRNFEYYSEDPLLSGLMAAGVTLGVQKHPGCGVTIKHFCANNQETNRYNNNSILSERALREIYLKGFALCIRTGDPAAVMTSYNLVNGVHTSQHYGLIHDILRCEFGFHGVVMTDWVTGGGLLSRNAAYPPPNAGKVAAATGDLFMPGSKKEIRELEKALKKGTVNRRQLRINVSRVLHLCRRLASNREIFHRPDRGDEE